MSRVCLRADVTHVVNEAAYCPSSGSVPAETALKNDGRWSTSGQS